MIMMRTALAGFLALIATTAPAHAYIDPVAGTFILQILAAAALGAAFYFGKTLSAVKRLFRMGRENPPQTDNDNHGNND